jgi:hypothetical protein
MHYVAQIWISRGPGWPHLTKLIQDDLLVGSRQRGIRQPQLLLRLHLRNIHGVVLQLRHQLFRSVSRRFFIVESTLNFFGPRTPVNDYG